MKLLEEPFHSRMKNILDGRGLVPSSAMELTGLTRPCFYGWTRPVEEGGYYPRMDAFLTLVVTLELSQEETLYLLGVENEG